MESTSAADTVPGPYRLDFYCAKAKLCIEVDSEAHERGDRPERDARRDAWLAERGVMTLRIPAVEGRVTWKASSPTSWKRPKRACNFIPPSRSGGGGMRQHDGGGISTGDVAC